MSNYKNMTKLLVVAMASLGFVSLANASDGTTNPSDQAIYVGVQGGYAWVDEGDGLNDIVNHIADTNNAYNPSKDSSRDGFGARLYAGFDINPYLALEAGYTYLPKNTYDASYTASAYGSNNAYTYNMKVLTYVLDISGKATLPLVRLSDRLQGWHVFGKLGMAYVHTELDQSFAESYSDPFGHNGNVSNSDNRINTAWCPTYGLGLGYDFNQHVGVDLVWNGILGRSDLNLQKSYDSRTSQEVYSIANADNYIPDVNFIGLDLHIKMPVYY